MVDSVELVEFAGGFFHGSFVRNCVSSINRFSFVADHFHRVTTGNTGAFQITDGSSPKIMRNPVADFLESPILHMVVQAVLMITGMFRVDRFFFKRAVASSPFIPGKRRSIMIRSGRMLEALFMASGPIAASKTS